MIYELTAKSLNTEQIEVNLPASKSISNRALIISALTKFFTNCSSIGNEPEGLADCDDTVAMIRALSTIDDTINIGAAGTTMRFLTAYYAISNRTVTLTGSERMKQRPIAPLVDALRCLGAEIEYAENEGFPPLHIRGKKLDGGTVAIPANISSQFVSAIMMIGPCLTNGLTIHLQSGNITSLPYINMTMGIMHCYGANVKWQGEDTIVIAPQPYVPNHNYVIEKDWSAASYWYEIMALDPNKKLKVILNGLYKESLQGDAVVGQIFKALDNYKNGIFNYDFSNCPDLAQTIVVTCAMKNIPFHFTGLRSLIIKETNRSAALISELAKMGVTIKANDDDTLSFSGWTTPPHPAVINTYKDHRMAMAFTPACLVTGSISIEDPMVVTKSYPGFWEDIQKIINIEA